MVLAHKPLARRLASILSRLIVEIAIAKAMALKRGIFRLAVSYICRKVAAKNL